MARSQTQTRTNRTPKPHVPYGDALKRIPLSVYRTHAYVGGSKRVTKEAKILYKYVLSWVVCEFARRLVENVSANKRKTIFPPDVQMEAVNFLKFPVAGIACAGLRRRRARAANAEEQEEEEEAAPAPAPAAKKSTTQTSVSAPAPAPAPGLAFPAAGTAPPSKTANKGLFAALSKRLV